MIPCMIVPILVGPDILHRMLDTIDYPIRKLIIIDNGDALRETSGWPVEHVQSTKVIKMPANLGVAGSWNLGVKAAPFAPWWLIVNFDVEWPAGSLRMFAEQAGEGVLLVDSPQPYCAFAIGEDAVQRVGLFDEGFHPSLLRRYRSGTQMCGGGCQGATVNDPDHSPQQFDARVLR